MQEAYSNVFAAPWRAGSGAYRQALGTMLPQTQAVYRQPGPTTALAETAFQKITGNTQRQLTENTANWLGEKLGLHLTDTNLHWSYDKLGLIPHERNVVSTRLAHWRNRCSAQLPQYSTYNPVTWLNVGRKTLVETKAYERLQDKALIWKVWNKPSVFIKTWQKAVAENFKDIGKPIREALQQCKEGTMAFNPLAWVKGYLRYGVVGTWIGDITRFIAREGSAIPAGFAALGLGEMIYGVCSAMKKSCAASNAAGTGWLRKWSKAFWQGTLELVKGVVFSQIGAVIASSLTGFVAIPVLRAVISTVAAVSTKVILKRFSSTPEQAETAPVKT